jgi:hypothetical protein
MLATGGSTSFAAAPAAGPAAPSAQCALGNGIQHVIQLQFDNVHFTRDNPNVPSDLEQMPHLLSFLEQQGTLLTNHHDVLQHTATNVLSALTGLYEDRHGITQSNSYPYYKPDGTTGVANSFAYWTDPLYDSRNPTPPDTTHTMLYSPDGWTNPNGSNVNTPAPWVPFTRAGCDVGSVATGNTVLENIGTDIPTVFGAGSPEAQEVTANPAQATADFVGLAVHCAKDAAPCAGDPQAKPDQLPDEPGSYTGYQALFGNKYVAPAISPSGPVTSLSGNVIADSTGHVGFPGFDGMTPDNALAYVADMQESGVPITYAYISDAHDNHTGVGPTGGFGPGEAGYVAQLKAYDDAFAAFFNRMTADGITSANTLFVVTTDEGDQFVGGQPSPAGCDGVTVPCTYQNKGEVNVNLPGLLATQKGDTTPFTMHSDPSPAIYVRGNPGSTDPAVRQLERDAYGLTVANPVTGSTDPLARFVADRVEQRILHLTDADPQRQPTFTLFGGPQYFIFGGAANCNAPCVTEPSGFDWNHGAIGSQFTNIWLGLAGPGVRNLGTDGTTWSDQTDIRPTVLALTGLSDDYTGDGRVLVDDLRPNALPYTLTAHLATLQQLGAVYKQVMAADGEFAHATLAGATRGVASTDESAYAATDAALTALGDRRDALAGQMHDALAAAAAGQSVNELAARNLIAQGQQLLADAEAFASGS